MKKGIVMEVKSDTLIMMTQEGEFIKTKKQPSIQYEIGEELTFFPQFEEERNSSVLQHIKKRLTIKPVLSSAAALLMLFFILFPSFNSPEVYAYVSVDINPSFEMSVSKNNEVLEIKPFNEEAEKILEQLSDWDGKTIVSVTEKIIDLSDEYGYMDAQKNVIVTAVFTEEAESKDKNSFKEAISQFTDEKLEEGTAKVSLLDSNPDIREEAQNAGMTAGQLLIKKEEEKQQAVNKAKEEKKKEQAVKKADKNAHKEEKQQTDSEKNNAGKIKDLPAAAKQPSSSSNSYKGPNSNAQKQESGIGASKSNNGNEKKMNAAERKPEHPGNNGEKNKGNGNSQNSEKNKEKKDKKDKKEKEVKGKDN